MAFCWDSIGLCLGVAVINSSLDQNYGVTVHLQPGLSQLLKPHRSSELNVEQLTCWLTTFS